MQSAQNFIDNYRKKTVTHDESHDSVAVGGVVSGEQVEVHAGRNIDSVGTQIVGSTDVGLSAGDSLTIGSAENRHSEAHYVKKTKSGVFGGGGLNVTVGKQKSTLSTTDESITHSGSMLGSLGGNISLEAGNGITLSGSSVNALQGDVIAQGKQITASDVQDTETQTQKQTFKQTGVTASVTTPVLNLAQTTRQAAKSGDRRDAQAMGLAIAGMEAYQGYKAASALANGTQPRWASVSVSVSVASSKSSSSVSQSSSTSHGSSLSGNNIRLIAGGRGAASDIHIQGSDLNAESNVLLSADHDISIVVGTNTAEQHSASKSSGGSLGAGYDTTGGNGAGLGVMVSASAASGNADGHDVRYSNSHVSAGQKATLISGHDTTWTSPEKVESFC